MSGAACAEEELECRQLRASVRAYEVSLRAGDYGDGQGPEFREKISEMVKEFNKELNKLTREYTKTK